MLVSNLIELPMEYVVEIFCFTIIFGYLFYKWANKNFECFSRRNIAHEKPVFLIGNNLTVLEGKESSPELLIRLHNQFKDEKIYGYYGFRSPHFFIRDPELIQKIGIKDVESFTNRSENKAMMSDETTGSMLTMLKDEKWIDMKTMLRPAFTENKISQVFNLIRECNKEAVKYLKETIKSEGTEIDLADYFHRYSNDVIASAAFGLEINSYRDKKNEFSYMAKVLLRTRSLCVAVKSFYLTISPQVLKIYRLNRIYIKVLAYVRGLFRTRSKDKIIQKDSISQKKGTEFFKIILALLKKSSSAVKSMVLTIFPQIAIIFYLYSFVQSIRNYVKGLFNPKLRQRQKEKITLNQDFSSEDIDTQDIDSQNIDPRTIDPRNKKNKFLKMGSAVLRKIKAWIKLLILTFFPQIVLISRLYTLLNFLRGKSIRHAAFLKIERFVVVIKLFILTYFPKISEIIKLNAFNAKALNYMKGVANQAIQQRQDDKIIRQDMIHLMLETLKREENIFENKTNDGEIISTKYVTKCTENEMVAQCILFLFAGLEPIVNMLCTTVYELMKNPDIQKKLYEEVAKMNDELNGADISYDLLRNMNYLDMVVSESLRKWPSTPLLERVCSKAYSLKSAVGEFIVDFKPGDVACFSVYGSHFDEDYFENPFTFDPERFSEQNKSNIRPFTYFPFGVGARSCLGDKFGLMVGKIMLYHLMLEFQFTSCPKSIPDLFVARKRIQLKQSEFFWMKITPRIREQILC